MVTLANVGQNHNLYTVKFQKDLRRKAELKLPPPVISVTALWYLAKS